MPFALPDPAAVASVRHQGLVDLRSVDPGSACVIDATANHLVLLDMPHLPRVTTVLAARNRIAAIPGGIAHSTPFLQTLALADNRVARLSALAPLQHCTRLEHVVLAENPVADHAHYRQVLVGLVPSLQVIDFERVRQRERTAAHNLWAGRETEAVLADLESEEPAAPSSADPAPLTATERARLVAQLQTATTMAEIDRIETLLSK